MDDVVFSNYFATFVWVMLYVLKGVKKVRSTLHHRISNHLKGNDAEKMHFPQAYCSL